MSDSILRAIVEIQLWKDVQTKEVNELKKQLQEVKAIIYGKVPRDEKHEINKFADSMRDELKTSSKKEKKRQYRKAATILATQLGNSSAIKVRQLQEKIRNRTRNPEVYFISFYFYVIFFLKKKLY